MKFITFFVGFCAIFLSFMAYSSEYHKHINVVIERSPIETQPIMKMRGVASAIASSQHSFDHSTQSWQGSFAIGAFDSDTAFSFGLGKRFRDTLINGNITQENGKYGGGVAVGFHF